jgi:hypothetical protein
VNTPEEHLNLGRVAGDRLPKQNPEQNLPEQNHE